MLTARSVMPATTVTYSAMRAVRKASDTMAATRGARNRMIARWNAISSAHQPLQFAAARRACMNHEKAHQHAETSNNNEQIEENHDLDQHRHARDQDLRAEEDTILQHQKAQNLTHGFITHREHEKSDELHRDHDGQGEHDYASSRAGLAIHVIRNHKREHHEQGSRHQARARLQNGMQLALHIQAVDNAHQQPGQY